jgi:hypothetical protein
MSWRSDRTDKYNRSEHNEYWLQIVEQETDCWYPYYWDDEDHSWWSYYGERPGYVGSMDEYHQMKVLTLLRKLNIRTASGLAYERGW